MSSLSFLTQKRHCWQNRSIGIEIETLVFDMTTTQQLKRHLLQRMSTHRLPFSQWQVKEDESIRSDDSENVLCAEIISPKMKLDETAKHTLTQLCEELHELNAITNHSTGLHVHCDATGLSVEQSAHIAVNYAFFQSVLDGYVHPSRRANRNEFCQSLPFINPHSLLYAHWLREFDFYFGTFEDAVPWNPHMRYHKLNFNNLRSFETNNTVENRHHHGTIDAEAIVNWTALNLRMIQQTVDNGICNGAEYSDLTDEVKEELMWQFIDDQDLNSYYTQGRIDCLDLDDSKSVWRVIQ